jgi:aminopeptidase N
MHKYSIFHTIHFMKYLHSFAAFVVLALVLACSPKHNPKTTNPLAQPVEPSTWDTLRKPVLGQEGDTPQEYGFESEMPSDTLPVYNASHTFEVDLLHSKIEISFDWAKKRAIGRAVLTMRPWFYATDKVTLDAKNFDIHSIAFEGQNSPLKYAYNNQQLEIQLGKTFTRNETIKLVIDYTAKPDERENFGGSAAITADKGLYFINADGQDKTKPRQIWTQGETESNSYWMPTVDKPNERCTQEMYITVEDKFKTLSNGTLISSQKNADGTRTDYWKMDKPHAPYLFMMAIGEFAVVQDKWRGINVDYYVEPKFEQDARAIFPYTPEMLEFFSNKLGYSYPWSKYSQVVVRDYVSGAMENTTAVIFGEFMQKNQRELLDAGHVNENVVAHEMFHHWFGDLVTTENWANLTLNEGFANYSEYLWLENKHGREVADNHLMDEQQGYLVSAQNGGHPLIHFGYNDREDMFDAHSYNKGGCVLHMLRHLAGDEAFFAALSHYLKKNEYSDVEADELRMAFEEVTGQDWNWFFNQWFFASGHPILDISYAWDESAKTTTVQIAQTQEGKEVPHIFELPLSVDIYDKKGNKIRKNIRMTQRKQAFVFESAEKPALVNVDADKTLLCNKYDKHSPEELAFMFRNAPLFFDRWEALNIQETENKVLATEITREALSDKAQAIRMRALSTSDLNDPGSLEIIEKMALNDPDNQIRSSAILMLGELADPKYTPVFEKGMAEKEAYSVVQASLASLSKANLDAALQASKALQSDDTDAFTEVLSFLYAQRPSAEYLPFFEKKIETVDGYQSISFLGAYQQFLNALNDAAALDRAISKLHEVAMNLKTSDWRRFAATKNLSEIKETMRGKNQQEKVLAIEKMISEIKTNETDPTLKTYYEGF